MTVSPMIKSGTLKWIALAFLIKLPMFLFFIFQFRQNWPEDRLIHGIFVVAGDTHGYYSPAENAVSGPGYDSVCRMPGLLPIYFLLRFFLNVGFSKVLIVFLQFLCSTLSVYLLARIAKILFRNDAAFIVTFFAYAFSSFVSLWDHFGYSDSFAVSFLIYSVFAASRYLEDKKYRWLIAAGVFITWSVFFRPVHGVFIPVLCLFLFNIAGNLPAFLKRSFIFCLPAIIAIGCWTLFNFNRTGKVIILQAPLEQCYSNIPPEMTSIRNLIIAWGGDILSWNKNSAGQWFFDPKSLSKKEGLKEKNETASGYNLDSLVRLRAAYHAFRSDSISVDSKKKLSTYIHTKSKEYLESYRSEKPVKFYFINRLRLLKTFMFPARLDYLPFPEYQKMKWYHVAIKVSYLLLFYLVNLLGLIGLFLTLRRKMIIGLLPASLIVTLGAFMGYTELRYYAPVYPFMLLLASYAVVFISGKFISRRYSKRATRF
jgi:hypothetical protein